MVYRVHQVGGMLKSNFLGALHGVAIWVINDLSKKNFELPPQERVPTPNPRRGHKPAATNFQDFQFYNEPHHVTPHFVGNYKSSENNLVSWQFKQA